MRGLVGELFMKCTHTYQQNVYLSNANESFGTRSSESLIRRKVKQVQIILQVPSITDQGTDCLQQIQTPYVRAISGHISELSQIHLHSMRPDYREMCSLFNRSYYLAIRCQTYERVASLQTITDSLTIHAE